MGQKASFLCQEYTKHTCTLAKSTRLRSLSIWLIWEVFCRTARAACARWFRDVYLRRVWAKALTADTCAREGRPFWDRDLSRSSNRWHLHAHLGLDHSLGNAAHGVGEPALKAFGKITDGLSQGTCRNRRRFRWTPKRGRQDHAKVSEQEDFKRLLFCSASLLLFDRKRLKYLY